VTKDERYLTEADVWDEHQSNVKGLAHWIYLVGVLGGALLLMLVFIAVLGAR
jgi:hypothetical protein